MIRRIQFTTDLCRTISRRRRRRSGQLSSIRVPESNLCVDKYALRQLPNNHTIQIQRRNYIFLPSTLSDASKMLKTLFDNNQQTHKRLMVKLQSRWQDTLFTYQEERTPSWWLFV